MDTTMIDTRDVILALKRVKNEEKLSLDKILELVEKKDPSMAVSKTTIQRVFRKGSENQIFRYENTLRPIANALLDMETVKKDDNPELQAIKEILKHKMEIIEECRRTNEELKQALKEEKHKYHEKLEKETEKFQKSLDFAKRQIELKDKRIDQLLDANIKLLNQLLVCPCRNGKQGDGNV